MVTGFLLDTDICSYAIKQTSMSVRQRLERTSPEAVFISVVTQAELLYGLALASKPERHRPAIERFFEYTQVLELSRQAAQHYGDIRATLKRSGQMIGGNDLFVAAHARSLGLTLVTNNVREYSRVPGLRIENWAEPA